MRIKTIIWKVSLGSNFHGVIWVLILLLILPITTFSQPTKTPKRQLVLEDSVKNLPVKSKRWALLIGINNYEDNQISALSGAANDAKSLADALIRYAGFPEEQVILITSDDPVSRPTRGNVLRRLSNLRGVVPKDGLLFIAFAGHGIERGGQAYLLPTDSQVSDDIRLLEDTAINITRVRDTIKEAGIRQVIFVVDACRNDPTTGRADAGNPLTANYIKGFNFDVRNKEITAFATLFATSEGKISFESKDKRQGYFTAALVEGLKGSAANLKGEVTLAGLLDYLEKTVKRRVQTEIGKVQQPFAVVEGYKANELVLSVKGQVIEREQSSSIIALAGDKPLQGLNEVETKKKPVKFSDGNITFEITSCRKSAGIFTCGFMLTNNSGQRKTFMVANSPQRRGDIAPSTMTDNLGNAYLFGQIQISGGVSSGSYNSLILTPDVPTKMTIVFNEINEEATQIKLLSIPYYFSQAIVFDFNARKIADFRNIPIN